MPVMKENASFTRTHVESFHLAAGIIYTGKRNCTTYIDFLLDSYQFRTLVSFLHVKEPWLIRK